MTYIYDKTDGLLKAMDAQTAEELVTEGKAFRLDIPSLDKAKKEAKSAIDEYKRREKLIRNSKDPAMVDAVKDYHVEQARIELDDKQKTIQREYEEARQALITEANDRTYRAKIAVSDDEREFAEQVGRRFMVELMAAPGAPAKKETLNRMTQTINAMSDGERIAIMPELLRMSVEDELAADYRKVLRAAQALDSFDPVAAQALAQLPLTASTDWLAFKAARSIKRGTTNY